MPADQIKTVVCVLFHQPWWSVDVEDTAPGAFRRYQLPTRYRTRASALRAARALAESMGATLDAREPWC